MSLLENWETHFKANGVYQKLETLQHGITVDDVYANGDNTVSVVNPLHQETILEHILLTRTEMLKLSSDPVLEVIALLHDVSKAITRTPLKRRQEVRFVNRGVASALCSINFIKDNFVDGTDRLNIIKTLCLFDKVKGGENIYMFENNETIINYLKLLFQANENGRVSSVEKRSIDDVMINWSTTPIEHIKQRKLKMKLEKEFRLKRFNSLSSELQEEHKDKQPVPRKLTLLIGLPGSGKSTYADANFTTEEIIGFEDTLLAIALEEGITGTFNEVRDNFGSNPFVLENKVWGKIHQRFSKKEKEGGSFVIDTYGVRTQIRSGLGKFFTDIDYVVFWRDYFDCYDISTTNEEKSIQENMFHLFLRKFDYPHLFENDSIEHIIV